MYKENLDAKGILPEKNNDIFVIGQAL